MINFVHLLEWFNFEVPGGRWQLLEFCDHWLVPTIVKHAEQNMLTLRWTKKLPLIHQQAPAELAADVIVEALGNIDDIDTAEWTLIDFCSGAGGPVPTIETLVNYERKASGKRPIPFRLSDIQPNIDAWMEYAALSEHLSFIPQPVDASYPPVSVISVTTPGDKSAIMKARLRPNSSKVFRLFCLSFHHFDDATAKKVLKSTLETSDAFAIIELQERRIGSLVLMVLEFWLLLFVTIVWAWQDTFTLLLTYAVPVLPVIHFIDGTVSCLRTRTFEETNRMVESVQGAPRGDVALKGNAITVTRGDWQFSHLRMLHTWPIGYMTVTTGRKIDAVSKSLNVPLKRDAPGTGSRCTLS